MFINQCILLLSLYSLDRLDDLSRLLTFNDLDINLSIAVHETNNPKLKKFLDQHNDRIISLKFHENYGVDIAPFLNQIYDLDAEKYPYFIKLHSKTSFWGTASHVDWGSVLFDTFIGDSFNLSMNLNKLSNPHVGMISNRSLILKDRELNNSHKINFLCHILDLNYGQLRKGLFAAGSMFMSKTTIFQKYLNSKYENLKILLSNETGKVNDANKQNGTYCHSLERIFGYIIANENLKISSNISKTIPVFNTKYRKLHLVVMYNNFCYLKEDLNIYGKIIYSNDQQMDIQWLHLDEKPVVYYKYINGKLLRDKNKS